MPLPEFKKMTQDKTAVPPWAKYLEDNEFISYSVSYKGKIYYGLFDEYVYPCKETGDIKYYVFDPVKHGRSPGKKYPVLIFLHGASNALMGVDCIMCCGAEQFASPDYQDRMGGAYIVVPAANEARAEDGNISGTWSDFGIPYHIPVKGILDRLFDKYSETAGSKIVLGASAGGAFTWKLLEKYPDYFDGAMPIVSGYTPSKESLINIGDTKTKILIAHGQHDEMAEFDKCIKPFLEDFRAVKNIELFLPKWVYNGDGGIASVFYGFEMGQHCMINWVQSNLMFDNGRAADKDLLPQGVTGWIKKIAES